MPFDERSRGFFSFLAYFTELEDTTDSDLILLLDEPGLSLHGRAQRHSAECASGTRSGPARPAGQ